MRRCRDASMPPLYARTGDGGVAVVIGAALLIIVRRRVKHG